MSYRGRKIIADGRTDGQDRNIYASSPLGGGIIKKPVLNIVC